MGIWTRVRSLWENEQALQATAEALQAGYKRAEIRFPERDPNEWLACALADRPNWGHVEKEQLILRAAPASITAADHATALLSLSVVLREYPELSRVVGEKQQELYLPIDFAIRNGTFLHQWQNKNPWTYGNYPAVEQELKSELLLGMRTKPAGKVHITCPKCLKELRIPGITGGKKIRCPGCTTVFAVDA